MQGRLRNEALSFLIESSCAQTGRPVRIEIDSDLKLKKVTAGADPHVFIPSVDLGSIAEESIIEVF